MSKKKKSNQDQEIKKIPAVKANEKAAKDYQQRFGRIAEVLKRG